MEDLLADVRRYDALATEESVQRIVTYLGVATPNHAAATMARLEEAELRRVTKTWCRAALGAEDDQEIERTMRLVSETMSGDTVKNPATFYYLCAKHLGKVEAT